MIAAKYCVFIITVLSISYLTDFCRATSTTNMTTVDVEREIELKMLHLYFTECLKAKVDQYLHSWTTIINFIIDESQWFVMTKQARCRKENVAACWHASAACFLRDQSSIVTAVHTCIDEYVYSDFTEPTDQPNIILKRQKRSTSAESLTLFLRLFDFTNQMRSPPVEEPRQTSSPKPDDPPKPIGLYTPYEQPSGTFSLFTNSQDRQQQEQQQQTQPPTTTSTLSSTTDLTNFYRYLNTVDMNELSVQDLKVLTLMLLEDGATLPPRTTTQPMTQSRPPRTTTVPTTFRPIATTTATIETSTKASYDHWASLEPDKNEEELQHILDAMLLLESLQQVRDEGITTAHPLAFLTLETKSSTEPTTTTTTMKSPVTTTTENLVPSATNLPPKTDAITTTLFDTEKPTIEPSTVNTVSIKDTDTTITTTQSSESNLKNESDSVQTTTTSTVSSLPKTSASLLTRIADTNTDCNRNTTLKFKECLIKSSNETGLNADHIDDIFHFLMTHTNTKCFVPVEMKMSCPPHIFIVNIRKDSKLFKVSNQCWKEVKVSQVS